MLMPTTLINTNEGKRRISYIMIGMKVETPDGMVEVNSIYKNKYPRSKKRIVLQDRTFVECVTKTRFFLEDGTKIKLNSLKIGMKIQTRDGPKEIISIVQMWNNAPNYRLYVYTVMSKFYISNGILIGS